MHCFLNKSCCLKQRSWKGETDANSTTIIFCAHLPSSSVASFYSSVPSSRACGCSMDHTPLHSKHGCICGSFRRAITDQLCLLVGALICLTTIHVHLELAPAGLLYYGSGYQIYSPWSNILDADKVHYGFRQVDGVLLRLPAGEEVPMDFGIREHLPAFEASGWWRVNRAMQPFGKVLVVGERRHVPVEEMSAYHGFIPVGYFAPYSDASELWTTLHQYMRDASHKKR